ncbi:AAA family ATPase [Sorangium atrum]|uniref:AAA family ATPase n=1 Tax=Sorangium atrum TaxID=2995308 RepID=A0ABT5C318_9BACT|nr:AAA family ATPase [Sorangium aterium]MDC0680373.1 AAA family ATPase [Sorangium aterium]
MSAEQDRPAGPPAPNQALLDVLDAVERWIDASPEQRQAAGAHAIERWTLLASERGIVRGAANDNAADRPRDDATAQLQRAREALLSRCSEGLDGDTGKDARALARAGKALARAAELESARGLVLGVRPKTGTAILEPLPEQLWLVKDLQWCAGRPAMLIAAAGSGKTIVCQSAAVSLAAGRPLFGWFWGPPRSRDVRVLHLDYEQGDYATRRRYQKIVRGMGLNAEELERVQRNLNLLCFPQIYLTSKNAEAEFKRAVDGVDLCIIDSLRVACRGLDENDSAIRDAIDIMTRVSQATGCAFLVVHHAGKSSGQKRDARELGRGSSAIFDASGSVLNLCLDGDGDEKGAGAAQREEIAIDCPKCGGSGSLPQYESVEGGVCFGCKGQGKVWRSGPATTKQSAPAAADPRRRVEMSKASAEGDGMRLEPFYLRFVDVAEGDNLLAGVRVEYRTEEQIKGPPEQPGDKLEAVKAKVLKLILEETRAGRPIAGKVVLAEKLGGRRANVSAAVDELIAEGIILDKPEKSGRGPGKSRLWAYVGSDGAEPGERRQPPTDAPTIGDPSDV